jgi:hypothetical protein
MESEPFKSIYRQSLGQCIDSLREFGYSITRLGLEQSAAFDSEWRHFKERWKLATILPNRDCGLMLGRVNGIERSSLLAHFMCFVILPTCHM